MSAASNGLHPGVRVLEVAVPGGKGGMAGVKKRLIGHTGILSKWRKTGDRTNNYLMWNCYLLQVIL